MTLSIASFRTAIHDAQDAKYVVLDSTENIKVISSKQWEKSRPDEWKDAKKAFLECLEREWGEGVWQSLPQRPQDGTPLEVREVRWMVEHDVVRKRVLTPSPQSPSEDRLQAPPPEEGDARQASGPTLADFRKLARADGQDCIARDDINGGFKLEREVDWRRHRDSWRAHASNEARKLFVESIKQEYPQISEAIERDIAPHLQQNGNALKSWHIQVVLDRVEALNTNAMADEIVELEEPDDPRMRQLALEVDDLLAALPPPTDGAGNDPLAEFDKSVDFGSRMRRGQETGGSPQRTIQEYLDDLDRDLEGLERDLGRVSSPRSAEPEETIFFSSDPEPEANPVQGAAPQVVPPQAEPAAAPPPRGRGLQLNLNRPERATKQAATFQAPKPRENDDPAGKLQEQAGIQLEKLFKGTVGYVSRMETEAAKTRWSKMKPAKKEAVAAETAKKFQLGPGDRRLADLFIRPTGLAEADKLLVESNVKTRNPLAVYFDLPKSMNGWLSKMVNAKTKLDAEQVVKEIDATFGQLRKDSAAILDLLEDKDAKLPKAQRKLLIEVKAKLDTISMNYLEEGKGELKFKSTPLLTLRNQSDAVAKLLPEKPAKIDPKHRFLAYRALTSRLGLVVPPMSDKALVDMANRMLEADHMLRRGLSEGEPWRVIHDNASAQERRLLIEYRDARIKGIAQEVRQKTGVRMETMDGEDGATIYYFATSEEEAVRRARHGLGTIMFAMGGRHRELVDVFGYERWDFEDVLAEQARRAEEAKRKAQADQAATA